MTEVLNYDIVVRMTAEVAIPPLSTAEVAARLGVTTVTVIRWARAGTLPAMKMPGRTGAYLFDADTVARFAAKREATA